MIKSAILTLRTLLPQSGSVTKAEIIEQIDGIMNILKYKDIDRVLLLKELELLYRIRVDDFKIIENNERKKPWIKTKQNTIDWKFWNRYKNYLQFQKNFPPDVVDQTDRLTSRILDGLYDPTLDVGFDKKGLVVGQVQSGKTANYTGLICKAADTGYNMIIILAGLQNNLRTQTQIRIDEGFLGFDTKYQRAFDKGNSRIGVGIGNTIYPVHSFTSSDENGDFSKKGTYSFHTNEPIVTVVKKNKTRLENLYKWLYSNATDDGEGNKSIRDKTLLIIDDEADNASINVSNDPAKRTAINGAINKILGLFIKSGYVGYTATPFANIFIPLNENDLFPRDFIVNLPAPTNYIGPEKIFGFKYVDENKGNINDTLPIITRIDDYQIFVPDKHKLGDPLPNVLPDSLKTAIRSFIITCAIRRLRGQTQVHNSMLIHVTRFVRWQSCISDLVRKQFNYYRRGIDQSIPSIIEEFRETFEIDKSEYYSFKTITTKILKSELSGIDNYIKIHTWDEVLSELDNASSIIEVREVNGGSGDILNYFDHQEGLSVIAIGGDKLSRGLTLEGLSVSYYLRASKMYDTLMQMGRWFGFRPGYVDLCRLYTSQELNEWFCHITHASEELREEFDYMSDVADSTPEKYSLKVRTHPGVLQITASNKMKSTVDIQVSWAGRLVESYELRKSFDVMSNNFEATEGFVSSLPSFNLVSSNYLWKGVSVDLVKSYLRSYQTPESLKAYDPINLCRFIDLQIPNGELKTWNVALMSKMKASFQSELNIFGQNQKVGCFLRLQDVSNSSNEIYYIRKSHIISPKDQFIDLTQPEYEYALELTKKSWQNKGKIDEPDLPSGEIVRKEIRKPNSPLLLIYLLDPEGALMGDSKIPFVGFAISFPGSQFSENVSYRINENLLEYFDFDDNVIENYDEED